MIYLSYGAGVQSTALLLMSNLGECERAEVAIFADTQDEPQWVYDQLEDARKWSKIPIEVVTAGKLSEGFGKERKRFASIPTFSNTGMLRRQCTREFKIAPIEKYVRRQVFGLKKGERIGDRKAICLIGISVDEAHRMKPNRNPWVENRWPLIDARMKRQDCEVYLSKHGIAIPKKSSCVYCPFHSDHQWKELKEKYPEEFAKAVEVDKSVRNMGMKVTETMYVHRSCKPLDTVDFQENQMDLFGNECEGYCGV